MLNIFCCLIFLSRMGERRRQPRHRGTEMKTAAEMKKKRVSQNFTTVESKNNKDEWETRLNSVYFDFIKTACAPFEQPDILLNLKWRQHNSAVWGENVRISEIGWSARGSRLQCLCFNCNLGNSDANRNYDQVSNFKVCVWVEEHWITPKEQS